MSVWAPEQMHKLGFRHREEYVKDREAMRGMTYDEEVFSTALTLGLLVEFSFWIRASEVNR